MSSRLQVVLGLALASYVALAGAQTATTARAVNVRAGPASDFPTVTWLLSGTSVTVVGCITSWRWCDIIAGRDRGWVYARYLAYPFNGRSITIVNGGPQLGLPAIGFSLSPYWDAHYRDRIWFARKSYWQDRWDRRGAPPAWREPESIGK